MGPFGLVSSTGTIEPGSVAAINVTSRPKQIGNIEEVVYIFLSECPPEHRKGIQINLCVNSCVPSVDLENYDDVFKEQYVVDSYEEFVCPEQVDAPYKQKSLFDDVIFL